MMRIGQGYDIHPLIEGRPLVIGGVTIPWPKGEAGHSDGDVLIHAIIDALLGASGLDDIGDHFPPGDEEWLNIDSRVLLGKTANLLRKKGWQIANLDSTVILQEPKLFPYKKNIRESIAQTLEVNLEQISVKAKTKEKFGPVGQGLAIEAQAVALLECDEIRTKKNY